MIYIDINMFLSDAEKYTDMAKNGTNVYICLDDGTELKLSRYSR